MPRTVDIRQGYVVIVDMVAFSEQVPSKQAEWVERFIAVLADSVATKLAGLDLNIFPTGDGAIISIYGQNVGNTAAIAPRALDIAIDLLRRAAPEDYELKTSINSSNHETLIDVAQHNMATVHGSVIQIGNGINLAERILNFAEPKEVVVTDSFWDSLANAGDPRHKSFCVQSGVFVKHMRTTTIRIYNPQGEETAWIAEPREARNPRHRRYAYFPPMKEQTLDRFREVGLETDILETVEYVYETIAAVNTGYKFISWAPLAHVLAAARPDVNEELLVFSRSDYEGHFWTTPAAANYLRQLNAQGFNQKRLFIYSTARLDIELAPPEVVTRLARLHSAGSLRKLESGRSRRRKLHRFRFGVTLYPDRGCLIAPVPSPGSFDEYLDIVKYRSEPWQIFDRFAERSFGDSEFKAFVVADKTLVAELVEEFVDLFEDPDSESLNEP